MFLNIGQIKAIVDSFMELTNGHPVHLRMTLSIEDEQGEKVMTSAGYNLEGLYPVKEISGIGASELPLCVMCEKNRVEEGTALCGECRAETWNSDERYGDDDYSESEGL